MLGWCHLKPTRLYLFWENWRQVQPNEFGRMPGPVAALELAAACIYKQETERERETASFHSETLPEEAKNSDQPSPDQHLIEQQTTSKH